MAKGFAFLLLALAAAIGACGPTRPPAARGGVERGTALPPPGLGMATARR